MIVRWLGRENEENVARTTNCCGWPSSPRQGLFKKVYFIICGLGFEQKIIQSLHICNVFADSKSRVYDHQTSNIGLFSSTLAGIGLNEL